MSSNDHDAVVAYDTFAETATALSGRYVALKRQAQDEDEQQAWWARIIALRDERRAVDPQDHERIVALTEKYAQELRKLNAPSR